MWKLSTSYKNNKIAGDEAEFKAIPSLLRKLLAKQSTLGLGGLRNLKQVVWALSQFSFLIQTKQITICC